MYIFGDASGLGFGSSSWVTGERTNYRYGIWGLSVGDDSSSNYRELRNLVETLEMSGASGELNGKEVFLFMDNSTAEAVAAKGSSTSPLLYELVLRLFQLSSAFLCSVNIIHVAGTRKIQQGTDGLSRGDMLEGVLKRRVARPSISLSHRKGTIFKRMDQLVGVPKGLQDYRVFTTTRLVQKGA